MQSSEQIRFCKSRDGTRIAFATGRAGPPLVWVAPWVHHLEFDWDCLVWRPWLALLNRRHSVVRFDWRGCGLSDRDGVEFAFDRYIEDLEAVAEAAGLQQFVLLGNGSGGSVAMAFAARYPDRVSHLVLNGCPVRGRYVRAATPKEVDEAQTRLKVFEIGWDSDIPAYGDFITALHMPDASPEQQRSYKDLLRRTVSPSNARKLLRSYWAANVQPILERIRCPTLVLHSTHDALIPFEQGRLIATGIADARLVPLETRNHVLLEQEPAWRHFVEALEHFLPEAPRAPAAVDERRFAELTARERHILEFVSRGLSNEEIAARLELREKTVRNHVSAIFAKLGAKSRAQAVALARDAGVAGKPER